MHHRHMEGQAGNLTIETNRLLIADRGRISTSLGDTPGSTAQAGTLSIQANNLQIEGIGTDQEQWEELTNEDSTRLILTGILSETNPGNQGDAGSIKIKVDGTIAIRDGGGIAATAQSSSEIIQGGRGGDIEIEAEHLRLDGGNLLTGTSATNGGNIVLDIADFLFLENESLISTSAGQIGAEGNGGNIEVNMPNGVLAALPGTNSDIVANSFREAGGSIRIDAQGFVGFNRRSRDELSRLLETVKPEELDSRRVTSNDIVAISLSGTGTSDNIVIPDISDSNRTEELASGLADTSNQIEQTVCRATQGSEFLVTGQGGVLPSPREQFRSEDVWEDWRLMDIAEVSSEVPSLSSTLPTEEQAEERTEGAIRAQHRQVNAPTLQPPNAQTLSLRNIPTSRSDRPTNPSMGYAVANPSYEQTPQLIEAQSWQTTPNGDIILVANAPSPNNSARLPSLTPPSTTCQTHSPATGESAS